MKGPDPANSKASALSRREFLQNAALGTAATACLLPSMTTVAEIATPFNTAVSSGNVSGPNSFGYKGSDWSPDTSLIWFPDGRPYFETPLNAWIYFRKQFDLLEQPLKAELKIFADSRYRLFINGEYVLRGPARSDPRWQYFDVLDVASRLRSGKNVLAVQVLYYGYNTGQYQLRMPGLAAELEISGARKQKIRTDKTWKVQRCDAYDSEAPRINGCQGAIEIFDARKALDGWTDLEFDDTSWLPAKTSEMGGYQTPYYRLLPRDIPLLAETEIAAQQISFAITVKAFSNESFLPTSVRQELDQIHADWKFGSLPSQGVKVSTTPDGQVTILTVDFGNIEPGYLQMEISAPAGTAVDTVYAEALWEGRTLFDPAAQRPIDRFILADGRNKLEVAIGWKGFRYVQLLVRNPKGPLHFHRIGIRTRRYPLQIEGTLQTPDAFQKELFKICARTVEICMQDAFVDLSREQQQWMGDGRWHAIYNYYLSGDPRMHRKLLAQIAQSQDAEGLTKSRYPDGQEHWAPIPAFCLMWITSFLDYYRFTGSLEPTRNWWPNILLALRWFLTFENADGLLENVPHWSYIDLGQSSVGPSPDVGRGGIVTALNFLYLEALHAITELAGALDDGDTRKSCAKKSARLGAAIQARLWSNTHGAYVDCLVDDKPSEVISDVTNALAVLHLEKIGSTRMERLKQLLTGQTNNRTIYSSPFLLPVVIRALIKMNRTDYAWEMVQQRYRPILAAGSTTTWEHWDLFHINADGSVSVNSASHAWGAGPLILFFEGFSGVRILKAGFKQFELAPHLGNVSELTFSLPTPLGVIHGRYMRRLDKIIAEFTVPPAASAVINGRTYQTGSHRVTISA